jgi:fermentation-respiration switch protein FrsA (DUF1100 family)
MTTRDEAIDFRVDDQRIAGTLVTPDTLIPGVLFVHGWGGSQEKYLARAREIAALGGVCLTLVRIALVLVAGRDGKTGASPASYDYEDIHMAYFMEPVSVRRSVPRPESVGSALVS